MEEQKLIPSTSKDFKQSPRHGSSSEYDSDLSEEENPTVIDKLNENYEDELENALNKPRKKHDEQTDKPKLNRAPKSKLPIHLKGLMGEANLRLARNDVKSAESICLELIRQEPYAFEPYETLAQIYESSHIEKSMEFLTIAAHLNSTCVNSWMRLAQYYMEEKPNYKKAVTCLSKAIKSQPKNYALYIQRISLLHKLSDFKNMYRCKAQLLQMYSEKHAKSILELAKELAVHYKQEKEYQKAIDCLSTAFSKCEKAVLYPELVNIFLELLLLNENYPQCLDIFLQYCNIEMELTVSEDNQVNVFSYSMPDNINVDLKTKFIICLIKLSAFDLAQTLVDTLLTDGANTELHGDLYLDIAEAFMSMDKHEEALLLLIPLTQSKNFSLAAVWLRHAECLKQCKRFESAILSYYKVVDLAPENLDVRHPLAELLLAENRTEEALQAMHQEYDSCIIDVALLLKKMDVLLSNDRLEEYFSCFELLLKRHCVIFLNYNELRLTTFQETFMEKVTRINKYRDLKSLPHVAMNISSIREPSIEEEYKIYTKILSFCYKNRLYNQLKKFSFYGLCSSRFKMYVFDISIVAIYACLLTKDVYLAFPIIRDLIFRNFRDRKMNHRLWNLYILALQGDYFMPQSRFIMRLNKHRKVEFLKIIEGCLALSNCSYKVANIYLMPFLKNQPTPFINMLLGVSFSMITNSTRIGKELKKKMSNCCFAFFANYASKRGKLAQQEIWYNLGRLNHHYGLLPTAAHYYKLVLDFRHPLYEQHADILDLKQEAAYNLSVIYKDTGNFIGARNIMMKYLTI